MIGKTFQRLLLTTTIFGLMSFAASSAKATQVSSALLVNSIAYGGVGYPAIKAYNPTTGAFLGDFIGPGNGLDEPDQLILGANGNFLLTDLSGDGAGGGVLQYNGKNGQFINNLIPYGFTGGGAQVSHTTGIATDAQGNIYIANYAHDLDSATSTATSPDSIMKFGPTGQFIKTFQLPTNPTNGQSLSIFGPTGVVFGPDGNLYVSSLVQGTTAPVNGSVIKFDPNTGNFLGYFVAPGANGLAGPGGIFFNNGTLYVTDYYGNQIQAYNATTGSYLGTVASAAVGMNKSIDGPIYATVSPTNQFVVVSDNNSAIAVIDPTPNNNSASAFKGYLVPPGAGGLNFPVLTALYANNITIGANAASVPEPSANLSLLGLSALGVGALVKRELKKRES